MSLLLYVGSWVAISRCVLTKDQRPLKIDELKHALSLHHEIEGDTLLSEYAEKDVELVRGSLVTVRQGTLQVIHLTVKEFLTITHGPKNSTYSDLLIDPAKASFHLTLACLKCISVNCNKSIVNLDPRIARLDIKPDVEAVIQYQRQAPLVEYASLTWMMHLTECEGAQMVGVSKAFQETFDSPSTFYWVEACMAFQPYNVLHLLAGLEEVIEYVSGLGPIHWPESESSCVFFADWCYALRNVFEEHCLTLSHRPWEVHFLDLQSSFSKIGQLYKQFGYTSRRDTTIHINGYESRRSCQPEAQAHMRLQQDIQGHSHDNSIFFIHDERRRLYLWGKGFIDLGNVRLFVQNATTGQRLPPAVKIDGEAGRKGFLSSYGLSPNGEYLVVVYWTTTKGSRYLGGHTLTLIWQISEELRFRRRMRSEPWARLIFSHECETGVFETPIESVVFTDGGYCLTPSGKIHLASGSRRPLLDDLSNRFFADESTVLGSFFSQKGEYLFISERIYDGVNDICRAIRVALFTETSEHICSWKDSSRSLAGVSPSGRYLVLSSNWTSTGQGDQFLYLYDVDTGGNIQLPFFERLRYMKAKYQFVKDEMELIVFIPCIIRDLSTMNVLVWSDLQSDPSLKSYGQLKLDSGIKLHQIHINKNESSALMVSESGVIQRVELRTQVGFPDAPDVDHDYPCTISQVSKDGVRWALLRYGENKAQLQMTDVSSAKSCIHRLDLELSPYDEPRSRAVAFSPDISVLAVDAQVFSIAEGVHSHTSASFTIQGLPELLERYRTRLGSRFQWPIFCCHISPCNSYIVFVSDVDRFVREAGLSTIYAFRIDLVSRSSTRLDLRLPKDLTYISADLHPSQHLMLLSYSSSSKPNVQVFEEGSSLQIYIVELEGLEMEPIGLPGNALFLNRLKE